MNEQQIDADMPPLVNKINKRSFPCSRPIFRPAAAYWHCSPPA